MGCLQHAVAKEALSATAYGVSFPQHVFVKEAALATGGGNRFHNTADESTLAAASGLGCQHRIIVDKTGSADAEGAGVAARDGRQDVVSCNYSQWTAIATGQARACFRRQRWCR